MDVVGGELWTLICGSWWVYLRPWVVIFVFERELEKEGWRLRRTFRGTSR
jgi:hypothetical protein